MRRLVIGALLGLIVAGGCGCARSLKSSSAEFRESEPSLESVSAVAVAAADETIDDGEPAISIDAVGLQGTNDSRSIELTATVEAVADSWDAAYRASEFGALVVPALFENSVVSTVTVDFRSEGDIVTYSFGRPDQERIDWPSLRQRIVPADDSDWPEFFRGATAYKWNAYIWGDVTSGGFPDGASANEMPRSKP